MAKDEINPKTLLEQFGDNTSEVENIISDIACVINKHSIDNYLNAPDFVIARYLFNHLSTIQNFLKMRDQCHGRKA